MYPLIDGLNCARFVYNGIPRVVRVIAIDNEHGNIIGLETKRGKKKVNKRYAKTKAFKLAKVRGGVKLTKN